MYILIGIIFIHSHVLLQHDPVSLDGDTQQIQDVHVGVHGHQVGERSIHNFIKRNIDQTYTRVVKPL